MNENQSTLDKELNLEYYWQIIKPRIHWLILTVLVFAAGGILKSFTATPMYRAQGTIMIAPEAEGTITFNERFAIRRPDLEYYNTQVHILRSRKLAQKVIEELNNPSYHHLPNSTGGAGNLEMDASRAMAQRIGRLLSSLEITPIRDTRLVVVACTSPSPERSTTIVNTLFDKYIEFNRELRRQSTKQTSAFIEQQMRSLREDLARKEEELQTYGKNKDLFYLNNEQTAEVGKFSDLNRAYTQAQIERIEQESIYLELKDKPYADFPDVRNNSLIISLKGRYSTLEGQYKSDSQVFKDDYPQMKQLRSEMESLKNEINRETRDIAEKSLDTAKTGYDSARQQEESLAKLLEGQKKEMVNSNSNAIYYNSLSIEVQNMREIQNFLDRKHKEALLTDGEGTQISNIRIIDSADVPRRQVSPNPKMLIIMALVGGVGIGLLLIFFLHLIDRSIKTPEEVKQILTAPTLGVIPAANARPASYAYMQYLPYKYKDGNIPRSKDVELVNYKNPESPLAESYRNIRTSLLLSTAGQPPRIITVSSARPEEGKTATAVNLAVAFQQLGKKVLLIDGDLRKPRIHKIFRLKNTAGLSSFLVGNATWTKIVHKTEIPDLNVIPSGPTPPNPVELLNSQQMSSLLEKHVLPKYDFVFMDSPPFVDIVDPILLGKLSDGMVMVTWCGKTSRTVISKAKDQIDQYDIKLLGVILNKVNLKTEGYGYAYQYKESVQNEND